MCVRARGIPMSSFLAILDAWILRMSCLDASLGSGISTLRSKRPGRMSAGSRMSGRLVAITTLTRPRDSKPSSCSTRESG